MDVAASAARGASKQAHFCSAAKLYAAAAAQGHRAALRSLGTLFVRGRGVAQDPVEAARLFAYAAGLGDTEAQRLLDDLNSSHVPKSEGGSLRLHVVLPETQRVSGAIDQSPAVAVVAPPGPKKRRRARKKGWGNSSRYKRKHAAAAATVSLGAEGDQLAAGICRWCVRRVWSHVHQPSRHGGAPEQQRVPQGQTEEAVRSLRPSTGERREAEARVPHTATHCLSAAYAVCKTKVGGLGGSPKKRKLLMFSLPPRAPLC